MGTTLTGTTPQDTYDSLIKVTDNGPISGTLKALSDGLGNDSTLSLSTTAASIAGTLAVTGNATFDTSTLVVDAANNRVGVGTASPDHPLQVNGNVLFKNSLNNAFAFFAKEADDSGTLYLYNNGTLKNVIATNGNSYLTGGNVGIGTSTASRLLTLKNNAGATNGISFQSLASTSEIAAIECNQTLDTIDFEMYSGFAGNGFRFLTGITPVERARFTANGLTFNGDTAAANALSDYETGTWTMGVSFGGASVDVTYGLNTGTYTKIGRQVTLNGFLNLTSKGSSTGAVTITGLPFTVANANSHYAAPSLYFENVSFANQFMGYAKIGTQTIELGQITEAGSATGLNDTNFANNSSIIIGLTYFV